MTVRRWIPWQDFAVFGGIPLLYTALVIGAAFTSQEWPAVKLTITAVVGVALYAGFALVVLRRWCWRPTYITRMGTLVWTNGLDIESEQVADAMCFYAANVGRAHKRLDESVILSLFSTARVEFTKRPIWWGDRQSNGLQRGKAVVVRWLGGFGENAFFHELHHMVDEVLLGVKPDYKHERKQWWALISDLKRVWRDGPKKEV